MSETYKLSSAEWQVAGQLLEEMDQLFKTCGILEKWDETDVWTGEPIVARQFTEEFVEYFWAIGKKFKISNKPWGSLSEEEKTNWAFLTLLGWRHRKQLPIPLGTLCLMTECILMFNEYAWVEDHVEPEKRDAAFVERCSKYSLWQSYGMPKTLEVEKNEC